MTIIIGMVTRLVKMLGALVDMAMVDVGIVGVVIVVGMAIVVGVEAIAVGVVGVVAIMEGVVGTISMMGPKEGALCHTFLTRSFKCYPRHALMM